MAGDTAIGGKMRLLILMSLCCGAWAENAQSPATPATFDRPGYESPLPVLLEVGTYHHGVSNGQGYWRGADAAIWLRHNPRFTPVFLFNSQTRPGIRQQNIGFFSFANWTKNFYTTQGFSVTPERRGFSIFPQQRYDLKGFYKVPFNRQLILSAGYSHFSFQSPVKGHIYNGGFIFYRPRTIIEGNYFLNRNQPFDKIGHAASLAVQRGQEGRYWIGTVVGGGKEVYSYIATTPLEVNLNSVSMQIFLRKWITRHYGYYVSFDHQTRFTAYSRTGATARMFFEF
ncbi:MAG: YaiO family outer membrane beta-barrel protein [Acidobacteria bacterium]|nr:YaiO family outer membrane beta-barrel protein [Acidobacteriota bacterium]